MSNAKKTPLQVWGMTIGLSLVVIIICTLIVRDGTVPEWERSIFRAINELPDWLETPMVGVQYAGVAVVPFVVAAIAAYFRKWRLVVALVLVYPAKLFVEKVVLKEIVDRGRPGETEPDAIIRHAPTHGPSFPSGHAIIAFAVAGIVAPYLNRKAQVAVFALATGVAFSRIYLAAHNPIDVVAGAAAGLLIAGVFNLVLGPAGPGNWGRGKQSDSAASAIEPVDGPPPHGPLADVEPAGERYFRNPGDVVRLVGWAVVAMLLVLFMEVAAETSKGISADLGNVAGRTPDSARELVLALVQAGAVLIPFGIVVVLVVQHRWRRLGIVSLAGALGAASFELLDLLVGVPGRVPGALTGDTLLTTASFPSLAYVAGAAAVSTVGKPWLARPWRRSCDVALLLVAVVMAVAGTAGLPQLLLAVAIGIVVGSALLAVLGAPNRRPSPAAVTTALRLAGVDVADLTLERADGGRAQLYDVNTDNAHRVFVKVYSQDSRDADLLFRGYRRLVLRDSGDDWPAASLERDVEHETLLLLFARRAGVACPAVDAVTSLPDGSMALALEHVDGRRLDELAATDIDSKLIDGVWSEVSKLHDAGIAHRSLRAANILVESGRPVIIDFGFGVESATPRLLAIDRAELLASLAPQLGSDAVVASAHRVLGSDALASAMPYLQPLALSAATRKNAPKKMLEELRSGIVEVTGEEPPPLEKLPRVRARTLVTIAALTAAFYVLLPQLANVGDSIDALQSADWRWLILCALLSIVTYIAAAISLSGGVPEHLPLVPTFEAQLASSFVNRVTPANVGGMALNVRFLRKVGVEPAEAVTGIGLNVLAGGVVHFVLLLVFVAWAGQGNAEFKIPTSSTALVVIAVVLAIAGIVIATRWGRRQIKKRVVPFLVQSWTSLRVLSRSPAKMLALFGGSTAVTLAYIGALAAAIAAFDGGLAFAQVGAVYLGASVIAAAAPTPGGLGAMEAALVAGLTGVGTEPGLAVAAVLSYRLLTYWLPVLPGWISFNLLQRHDLI